MGFLSGILRILLLLSLTTLSFESQGFDAGFWYDGTRAPETKYDTVPYANLTVRIDRSYFEGPGQNLVSDPSKSLLSDDNSLYTGLTVNRQTFDTQFILDMQYALGLDADRIYVLFVSPGHVHFSWETENVVVNFIFLERNNSHGTTTLLEAVASLTSQIQDKDSLLFKGNVTKDLNSMWGLEVVNWDMSLKLSYAIEVIGGDGVIDNYYLNQGGMSVCDGENATDFSMYCEFERFFEDDVSTALDISYYRVQILFVKKAAYDSVLVYFRLTPAAMGTNEKDVTEALADLHLQVHMIDSLLYKGNVTIRVDPLWGVSEMYPMSRLKESLFTLKWYEYDPSRLLDAQRSRRISAYDRCKANRRCNWGVVVLNQSSNQPAHYQRLFEGGTLYEVDLFLDFEDWRLGSRGFSFEGKSPPVLAQSRIRGAHFSPFASPALGPNIPCYEQERNQGLVLDRQLLANQILWQESLISDLEGRIDWLGENVEWATMGPVLRSRKDVKENVKVVQEDYQRWLDNEIGELDELSSSQCSNVSCVIMFNTSSLELTGAMAGTGDQITTEDGTEVAVFSFNSIYLGPEVQVILCGQRAFSLVSRTTAVINTTFTAVPGTLGGFPGGYSVARQVVDSLDDRPRDILICELGDYCDEEAYNVTKLDMQSVVSNNVNGPGSGNLRVSPFIIYTEATVRREVQRIRTSAQAGQTLAGSFVLHFGNYSTTRLPHDISASSMKYVMESNLNSITPFDGTVRPDRAKGRRAGVGVVEVTRVFLNDREGFEWNITFVTAIGNIPQLKVTSYLVALGAEVHVTTLREGNEIEGSFRLNFMGEYTEAIPANVNAAGLKEKLLGLSNVRTAYVDRIDPTGNCDDGLCPNGPRDSRGLTWTLYITTDGITDNVTPFSPSSVHAREEGQYWALTADTTSLVGEGITLTITRGTSTSPEDQMKLLNVTRPFSLAFGGAGGSYGGRGGFGYSENPAGMTYNDEYVTDLLGGSGGCMRSTDPFMINSLRGPVIGRGGHGGGAIEVVASNDIVIGSFGKIIVNGGDGDQTSEGGGGGGSGGSISLAAGGVVLLEGYLDISGGRGGYGGTGTRKYFAEKQEELAGIAYGTSAYKTLDSMSGGGGGGGRLAIYAESIVTQGSGRINDRGGQCGVYKKMVNETILRLNVTVFIAKRIPLNDERIIYAGATYINMTMATLFVDAYSIDEQYNASSASSVFSVQYSVVVHPSLNASLGVNSSSSVVKKTVILGQMLIAGYVITHSSYDYMSYVVESPSNCTNDGSAGSVYMEATMTSRMFVRETSAAELTSKALFLSNIEVTRTLSGSVREAPFARNGPTIPFAACRPGRVTYYTRLDSVAGESKKSSFGTLFTLLSHADSVEESIIGVYLGDKIMHGVNFAVNVDENYFLKRLVTIDEYPAFDMWYKVDIHIDWGASTYYILMNDIVVSSNQKFVAKSVDGIRLSVNRAASVWFDEIYVGFDNTMGYKCPEVGRRAVKTGIPTQYGWSLSEEGGVYETDADGNVVDGNALYRMQRHYNHLDPTGSAPFDGEGQINLFQDIKFKFASGDYEAAPGKLHAGAMFYVTDSQRSGKSASGRSATVVSKDGLWYQAKEGKGGAGDGRQFMYSEYLNTALDSRFPSLYGGIAACSSNEMTKWRFEGIVFHYFNQSDMVYGSKGPFYMERPRVLFNKKTKMYVLWATMDNANRSLAMSAVATSPYEDGPFLFKRSMYPDGNRTRDQVIYEAGGGQTVLGRTYYATIEYVLPEAVMQPSWESAKNRDGVVDFRLSYQRSQYEVGYDNFHDTFEQRWRDETNIGSRFVDPTSTTNSWWIQSSVPSVQAQPWSRNYRDGYCGVRKLDDDLDLTDPNIANFRPDSRGTCSNIADNPIHPALQDKLIGVQRVVFRRRAKFIALSSLTEDYMDTSGYLNAYEGEFDSGNLVTMISEMGQFGFKVDENFVNGTKFRSTFPAPVRSEFETTYDFKYRFRQYMHNYNDRAYYALACAIDGICSVNFRQQVCETDPASCSDLI